MLMMIRPRCNGEPTAKKYNNKCDICVSLCIERGGGATNNLAVSRTHTHTTRCSRVNINKQRTELNLRNSPVFAYKQSA